MIFIVCLHILGIYERCRENRSCRDFNACFDLRAPSWLSVQLTVYLPFHVSSPHPLKKARRLLDCISSTVYRFLYCHTVLNFDGRVHTVTCRRLFHLFPHTSFYTFSHLRILFSASFCSFPVFFLYTFPLFSPPALFFSALHWTRLSPCLFQFSFVSTLAQRQASQNSYTSLPEQLLSCLFCPL